MKGKQIFTLMEGIDPALVEDAMPASWEATIGKPPKRRRHPFRALGRFLETGWAAAILSVIVSVAVLVGVVAAGRMAAGTPGPGTPVGGTNPGETSLRNETAAGETAEGDPIERPDPLPMESLEQVIDYLHSNLNFTLSFDTGADILPTYSLTADTFPSIKGYQKTDSGNAGFSEAVSSLPTDAEGLRRYCESTNLPFVIITPEALRAPMLEATDGISTYETKVDYRAYYCTDFTPVSGESAPFDLIGDGVLGRDDLTASGLQQYLVVLNVKLHTVEYRNYILKEVIVELPFLLHVTANADIPVTPTPEDAHITLSQQNGVTQYLNTPYMVWESGITIGPDGEEINYEADGSGALYLLPDLADTLQKKPYRLITFGDASLCISLSRPDSVITCIKGINPESMQEVFTIEATQPVASASVAIDEFLVGDSYTALYLVITVKHDDGVKRGEDEYPVLVLPSTQTPSSPFPYDELVMTYEDVKFIGEAIYCSSWYPEYELMERFPKLERTHAFALIQIMRDKPIFILDRAYPLEYVYTPRSTHNELPTLAQNLTDGEHTYTFVVICDSVAGARYVADRCQSASPQEIYLDRDQRIKLLWTDADTYWLMVDDRYPVLLHALDMERQPLTADEVAEALKKNFSMRTCAE